MGNLSDNVADLTAQSPSGRGAVRARGSSAGRPGRRGCRCAARPGVRARGPRRSTRVRSRPPRPRPWKAGTSPKYATSTSAPRPAAAPGSPRDELGVAGLRARDRQHPGLGGLGVRLPPGVVRAGVVRPAVRRPTRRVEAPVQRAVGRADAADRDPRNARRRAGRRAAGPSSSQPRRRDGRRHACRLGHIRRSAHAAQRRGRALAGAAPVAQQVDVELELGAGRREREHRVVELVRAAPAAAAGRSRVADPPDVRVDRHVAPPVGEEQHAGRRLAADAGQRGQVARGPPRPARRAARPGRGRVGEARAGSPGCRADLDLRDAARADRRLDLLDAARRAPPPRPGSRSRRRR